jgi:hypothetical protein
MSAHLYLVAPETGSRILLVEDDHEIASMVVEMLSDNNFDAIAVGSAADLDVVMRNQSFDLIGRCCRDQISTFCIYAAGIENSLIDPGCRTNIMPPAAITSVK